MLNIYVASIQENKTKYLITTGLAITMKCLGYSVGVYKPIQMGCEKVNDKVFSKELNFLNNADSSVAICNTYFYGSYPNPLIAGVKEGNIIDRKIINNEFNNFKNLYECNITEGSNGFGTPLNVDYTEDDMMTDFNIPTLFIVSPKETSLNNVIMSLNHAKTLNLDIRGVIFNDYPDTVVDENIKFMPRFIEEYTDAKVLGVLPAIRENILPQELIDFVINGIDLEAVFNVKIEKLQI